MYNYAKIGKKGFTNSKRYIIMKTDISITGAEVGGENRLSVIKNTSLQ